MTADGDHMLHCTHMLVLDDRSDKNPRDISLPISTATIVIYIVATCLAHSTVIANYRQGVEGYIQ